jgi:two-component system NtrC family response regulator
MANVLIIDDEEMLCSMMCEHLKGKGHDVTYALTLEDGLKKGASSVFDVIFLDVGLPDGNGLEALPRFRGLPSSPEVIIFTGAADPDGAELAVKSGAWDYVAKPPSMEQLTLPLVRALQYREEKARRKSKVALRSEGIVGSSPQIEFCLDLVAQAANTDANVLINGETGTGKELFAIAIHKNSPRADKNFVVVDCAALPETLVESMLFGHEKGAFTGADRVRSGLIKHADGGTLFLDEVGELPLPLQKPFLRVLQEHRFRPVGGSREVQSDFRLVAATNRNLDTMVAAGQFREDFLYRLKSFTIDLPPLRGRQEDIRDLTMYHMARLCDRYGTETKGFSPEFFQALSAYDWPGNVRELINVLERTLAAARYDPTIFPKHLPEPIRIVFARSSFQKKNQREETIMKDTTTSGSLRTFREYRQRVVDDAEDQYLKDLMKLTKRNIKDACRISGLSRPRLYALLKKHNMSRRK